ESFEGDKLMPLVQKALQQREEASATVPWDDSGREEVFHAVALPGFGDKPAAVLLVGNSLQQQKALEAHIAKVSLLIALCGVAFGLILSGVIAAHITHPVNNSPRQPLRSVVATGTSMWSQPPTMKLAAWRRRSIR